MWSIITEAASRTLLYTTLTFNVGAWALTSRDWYNYIDSHVILGALPFSFLKEKLITEENIGAVISLNMPYERQFITTTTEEWAELGVDHFKIDIPDFISTPSVEQMWQGIELIRCRSEEGRKTYVHCKAGRSRSATMCAAYVMQKYDKNVMEAVELVTEKRPHVKFTELQLQTLYDFSKSLEERGTQESQSESQANGSSS